MTFNCYDENELGIFFY